MNKKTLFLVITLTAMLILVTSVNAATDNTNTSTTHSISEKTTTTEPVVKEKIENTQTKQKITSKNNKMEEKTINKTDKRDGKNDNENSNIKTIVVNNDTVDDVFSGGNWGLNDSINPGDILDFQGSIDKNHRLLFNKPINAISTTNDAIINLHTDDRDTYGWEPVNSFKVNSGGSNSNFTNLFVNETQLWVQNTTKVTFDNMTFMCTNVGRNIGSYALRSNATYITIKNSYLFKANASNSMLVFTGADNCLIENCTIESDHTGNVVYWNFYNTDWNENVPYTYRNFNNTLKNCSIFATSPSDICILTILALADSPNIIGCKYYGSSSGITGPVLSEGSNEGSLIMDNEFYGSTGIYSSVKNAKIINNTIYGTGEIILSPNNTYLNNTMKSVNIDVENINFEHNIVKNDVNLIVPFNLSNNILNNLNVLSSARESNLTGNNISGTVTITADNVNFVGNTIQSSNELALVVSGANNNISNNFIATTYYAGQDVVSISEGNIYENNVPVTDIVNITDKTYSKYFDNDGILRNNVVNNYTNIKLYGTFTNKKFIFNNSHVNVNGINAKLINSTVKTENNAKITIKNVLFNNTNSKPIILNSSENIITSNKIYVENCKDDIIEVYSNNNKILDNFIEILNSNEIKIINNYKNNNQYLNNSIILNNNHNNIIISANNNNNMIINNTLISYNSTNITGIYIISNNSTIYNNKITVFGEAIKINDSNNLKIIENNINSTKTNIYINNLTNADISSNNLKSENSNIILVNSNNNNIKNNTLKTKSKITIKILNTSYNNINNNILNAENLIFGNETIYQDEISIENILENNNETKTSIILTNESYTELFDENGNYKYYNTYDQLVLGSNLYNIDLTFNNDIKFINQWEYVLFNSTIYINNNNNPSNKNITIDGIFFNNNNKPILFDNITDTTKNNVNLLNSQIILSGEDITGIILKNIEYTLENNNIIANGNNVILVNTTNTTNSKLNTQKFNKNKISIYSDNQTYLIYANGTKINLIDNEITLVGKQAICLFGQISSSGKWFMNNNITMKGENISLITTKGTGIPMSYMGGNIIYLSSQNPIITINAPSSRMLVGFESLAKSSPNTFIINATQNGNATIIEATSGTVFVRNNYIASRDMIGNELAVAASVRDNNPLLFPSPDININTQFINNTDNKVIFTVYNSIGYVNHGTVEFDFDNKHYVGTVEEGQVIFDINVNGSTEEIIDVTFSDEKYGSIKKSLYLNSTDYLHSKTFINLENIIGLTNEMIEIQANIVDENNTLINQGYIVFTDETGSTIGESNVEEGYATINVKYTNTFSTNITATYTSENETILNSNKTITLTILPNKTKINTTTEKVEIGKTTNITAEFYTEDGTPPKSGKAIFRVNGKTLRDDEGNVMYVDVVNGQAILPDITITSEWLKPDTTIQAIYSGTDELESIITKETVVNVTKPKATIEITAPTEQATAGQTITLTAKVTEGENNINIGRVAFKLNGKTLKDPKTGKALYAEVRDGVATITYTIPEKTKAKEYTLTAVFTDSKYDRVEAESKLNVVKA